jgi:hypothetical protein
LKELMANRIEEMEYEVSESSGGEKLDLPQLIGPAICQIKLCQAEEKISKYVAMLQNQNNTTTHLSDKEWCAAAAEVERSQNEITRLRNIQALLKQIMEAYRNDRLPLLPVTKEMLVRAKKRVLDEKGSVENSHFLENWSVYFHILNRIKQTVLAHIIGLEAKLLEQNKEYKEIENHGYGLLLQKAKFVGMTTTGAAKYSSILHMMKAKMGMEISTILTPVVCHSVSLLLF